MNRQGNPTPLVQARHRDSINKRRRVLTAIECLEHDGTPITHTAIARTAGVSTWLTYAEGVREHIHAAQARQNAQPPTGHRPASLSPATLRTDLELARQEITTLREERDRLRTALSRHLGQQLDALSSQDLTTRIDELTQHNHQLADQLQQATTENTTLSTRVAQLEDDLAAARTSLRRMIRDENHNP
ncbi:DUF6262 family protein (plasmid) [Streptomyces sp. NBC_01136]|uniref:DUF6262 family protein n=1 Tax=unclassified Streptomyces TaxID=2593676 RepID=UPI002F914F77|nr:DUF6262 family protein [Streptomyces sp. NBC_01136]WST82567.1 DUF6262 family protein [Streptomyces sp. NBC_01136]